MSKATKQHTENCLWCDKPIKQPAKGRKKRFCNDNHRWRYHKKKLKGKTDDVLVYKEFVGSVQYSREDDLLHGKILNIDDLITYEGKTLDDLKKCFIQTVDDYIETRTFLDNNKKQTAAEKIQTQKPYMNEAIKKKIGLTK